jgi:hypothetical protein
MRRTHRKKLLFLLALAAFGARADIIGHIKLDRDELEFYNNDGWCKVTSKFLPDTPGYDVARYPNERRDLYVIGCWKPLDAERFIIRFQDGVTMTLSRKQFIPVGKESGVVL